MKKIALIICLLACVSMALGSESFRVIIDRWLSDDKVADFNKDGVVNLKDVALIQAYGSDEYGLDSYGR
jgi:hypothetical protein